MTAVLRRLLPTTPGFQPRAWVERARQSLFLIPGAGVLLGAGLAELLVRVDRAGVAEWLPTTYETSEENARAVLGTVAAGSITVVTLLLTITLVAVQLAAGQLSPRTISDYLDDRFQQVTIGVVLGTASYGLTGLRSVRSEPEGVELLAPDLTVLGAFVLTVVALLFVVRSIDRSAGRLQVGRLIEDLASETCSLVRRRFGPQGTAIDGAPPADADTEVDWSDAVTVVADTAGWVQHIDEGRLLDALPERCRVRLPHPVGTFVLEQMVLVEVLADDEVPERSVGALRRAIVLGEARTMQQDVGFGIDRLVDIAMRALSPGVNDPNTAREVVLRLSQILLALFEVELPPPVRRVGDRVVHRPGTRTHDDYVAWAFDQIREAARDQPAVESTLRRALDVLSTEVARRGLPGSTDGIDRQRRLLGPAAGDLVRPGAGPLP